MCGIVGAVAQRDVSAILLEGLSRLEYRGYDSAGLATICQHDFVIRKTTGKVQSLKDDVLRHPVLGTIGIAHTRWATHGKPSTENAHPHNIEDLALVHNGIIENFTELKEQLIKSGYTFKSQTDTEVLLALIHLKSKQYSALIDAFRAALKEVKGSYALALLDKKDPDTLYAVREGSPLVIGLGVGENFVASDIVALVPVTSQFIYLAEGEMAVVRRESIKITTLDGTEVEREAVTADLDAESVSKGHYRHFMQKEIYEQPDAMERTLFGRLNGFEVNSDAILGDGRLPLDRVSHIKIIACGTSYHAGLVAKYFLEEHAKISTSVEIASEYRYRKAVVPDNSLFLTLSQSGETADTLACLRLAKEQGKYLGTMCVCNVATSSLVRESDLALITRAGTEIGVAATKSFTTQLLALLILTLYFGRQRGTISDAAAQQLTKSLHDLPKFMQKVLASCASVESLSLDFVGKSSALFLGRGAMFPIALEGALKLKEISYIHAEGYAAGELKHGPIALIDRNTPVVVVAPDNHVLDKLKSNIEEVKARGAKVYIFASQSLDLKDDELTRIVRIEGGDEWLQPLLFTLPLQLLSYHVALLNGTDVDQPRNLAKSVTVE